MFNWVCQSMVSLGCAVVALSLVSVVSSAGIDQKAAAYVLCKNQKNVRTIRVTTDPNQNDVCSITYTKGGLDEVVGANRNLSACKSILQSIRANLEDSNWNCRNISKAGVSTSSEAVKQ
jgi:hypothetical protein